MSEPDDKSARAYSCVLRAYMLRAKLLNVARTGPRTVPKKYIEVSKGCKVYVLYTHRTSHSNAQPPAPTVPLPKTSLLQRMKEGVLHYWHGSRLLCLETKISFNILRKLLRGEKLIRREYRQLLRTTGDLLRLVPFVIIMIVPFLEFALPLILKFFPNMLPSTFEDKLQAEEKVKKQLKVKLETARFLQDLAEGMANGNSKVEAMKNIFQKARISGKSLTAKEVLDVSRHLIDAVRLDNLGRPELLSLCRYMGLSSFGTDNYLRYQIQRTIDKLKADDLLIHSEGIDSLSLEELKSACHARGIRTIGVPERYMQHELEQWLDLQIVHCVPAPLLILSRALTLSENVESVNALKEAVESLPEPLLAKAEAKAAETMVNQSPEEKIKELKEEQTLIKQELFNKNVELSTSTQAKSDIETLSEVIAPLASASPAFEEKEDLKELKEERVDFEQANSSSAAAKAIETQVDKLIADIEKMIPFYETEIRARLQSICPSKEGSISVEEMRLLLEYLRDSPKDAKKMSEIIKAFDKDGDGKIFVRDILELAYKAKHELST